ncbi:MAG: substrate-binding domain-containing protein, partial [Deltaproteobacteria bacterium]|nr:substrate-binding domain-containing protein [Deltaproteobacteria bacterium]
PLLHAEAFREERLIPFVRRDHPFARRRALTLAEIAESPVVIRTEFNRRNWTLAYLTKLQHDHFKWKNLMYCESFDAVKRAVRGADCVGIMHEDLLQENLQRREFKFLKLNDTALTAQNYLYYSTQNPLSPVAESFVSLLRAARDKKLAIGNRLASATDRPRPGRTSQPREPVLR